MFESSTSSQNPGNIHYPVFNYLAHESTWGAAGSAYPVNNSRNEAQEMQARDNVEYVSEDFSTELEGVNMLRLSNDSSPDTSDTEYIPSRRPYVPQTVRRTTRHHSWTSGMYDGRSVTTSVNYAPSYKPG